MVLVWPRKPPAGEGKRSIEGAVPLRRGDQRHPRCVGRRTCREVLAVLRSSLSTRPWTHASLILCHIYATPLHPPSTWVARVARVAGPHGNVGRGMDPPRRYFRPDIFFP